MKQRTQNYYLIALRSFLKFVQKQGVESLSPERIKLSKVPERPLEIVSLTEIKRLLDAPDQKTLEGKRDRAILELLFSTGLRISELTGLCVADVDLLRDEFSVRGKRGKIRRVFLSDTARKSVQEYLQNRKDLDDALFVRYGRKMHDGGDPRLSPRAVQRLVKKYAGASGITKKVTPHVIRHSFATYLMNNGVELHSVQALLGHENLVTTKVYTNVTK